MLKKNKNVLRKLKNSVIVSHTAVKCKTRFKEDTVH